MDKLLGYIGMARKAGKLELGAEKSGAAVKAGRAKLLLLAEDASKNAVKKAEGFAFGRRTRLMKLPYDKAELSAAVGRSDCVMAALTDEGLARAVLDELGSLADTGRSITGGNVHEHH